VTGKFVGMGIVVAAAMAGIALYYLQVHHFYEPVAADGAESVRMTSLASGMPEPVPYDDFKAIDADSSPIRYRACFTTQESLEALTANFESYGNATPLNAPAWFDCFDAGAIGKALEDGKAIAFLGEGNFTYGFDRVVAVMHDGRGFAWHQINRCGERVFDGEPPPEGCPPSPGGG